MLKNLFNRKVDNELVEVFLRDLQATTFIKEDKQIILPFLHSERCSDYVKTYIEYVLAYKQLFDAHCKRLYAARPKEIDELWNRYVDFLYKNI